jgi:hypothetical protein
MVPVSTDCRHPPSSPLLSSPLFSSFRLVHPPTCSSSVPLLNA